MKVNCWIFETLSFLHTYCLLCFKFYQSYYVYPCSPETKEADVMLKRDSYVVPPQPIFTPDAPQPIFTPDAPQPMLTHDQSDNQSQRSGSGLLKGSTNKVHPVDFDPTLPTAHTENEKSPAHKYQTPVKQNQVEPVDFDPYKGDPAPDSQELQLQYPQYIGTIGDEVTPLPGTAIVDKGQVTTEQKLDVGMESDKVDEDNKPDTTADAKQNDLGEPEGLNDAKDDTSTLPLEDQFMAKTFVHADDTNQGNLDDTIKEENVIENKEPKNPAVEGGEATKIGGANEVDDEINGESNDTKDAHVGDGVKDADSKETNGTESNGDEPNIRDSEIPKTSEEPMNSSQSSLKEENREKSFTQDEPEKESNQLNNPEKDGNQSRPNEEQNPEIDTKVETPKSEVPSPSTPVPSHPTPKDDPK
ncbi:unnamed protein product [Owenia fusiformis]|uniref:Uncharacterized protein n=1 Tax=Owenia fusiformis TaxID=6347 RepID=A0A8S4NQ07_OWEFU|nr:unnamed protein product [Owenia fusiformis]